MDLSEKQNILRKMEFDRPIRSAVQFCSEEDGSPYDVWKIETDAGAVVLKKISLQEREVWQTFFPHGAPGTPKVYGLAAHEGQDYLLMEFFAGETLSQSSRSHWQRALDALIALQRAFWDTEQAGAGWTFEKKFASEQRWRSIDGMRNKKRNSLNLFYWVFLFLLFLLPKRQMVPGM